MPFNPSNLKTSNRKQERPRSRAVTVVMCPGVRPMPSVDGVGLDLKRANENRWYDILGFRRHWYANAAALLVFGLLLGGGLWIVGEFTRLQKIEACFEAGRTNCLPLDYTRRSK